MPIVLLLLFFFSGLASLVYEVTWLKLLAGALSNSTHALSLVLAGFLLGLALGSRECGRHGGSIVRPIAAYAWLEVSVAGLAAGMPFALKAVSESALSFLPAGFAHWVRLVVCGALVLVATIPIGATFPLQIRAFDPSPRKALRAASFILAFQTAGGMSGVLLSGFVLLPAFGIRATHFLAVSITTLVAACALVLSVREPRRDAEVPLPEVGGIATFDDLKYRALCISVALVGGASLALEVIFTRILTFFLPDVAYSFSAVLAVYLLAIAGGSLLAVALARRSSTLAGAGVLAVVAGCLTIGSLLLIPPLLPLLHWFESPGGGYEGPAFTVAAVLGSALLIAVPAAFLAAFLPIGIGLLAPGHGSAPSAGAAFSSNSIGSACGALLAGLALVPCVGVKGSVVLVGCLVVAGGVGLIWVDRRRIAGRGWQGWYFLIPAAALLPLFLWWGSADRPLILDSRVFRGRGALARSRELVESRAGSVTVASVVLQGQDKLLYNDAFQAAGTGRNYRYMKMLGHLPMLRMEQPEQALVIAFGTGTTAGSLSLHPSLEQLTVVEISPEVLDLAPHFRSVNFGLPDRSPGEADVSVVVDDGRAFLRRSDSRWDVISLEPLLPATPAAVHFYTREFFELARSRLKSDGVLCHWIPIHAQPVTSLQSILATFFAVFPEGELYLFGSSAVLLGWNGAPPPLDFTALQERMAVRAVREDLQRAGLLRAEEVLGSFVARGRTLRDACRGVPPNTDDHSRILYAAIRPRVESFRYHEEAVAFLLGMLEPGPEGIESLGLLPGEAVARAQQTKAALRLAEAAYQGGRYRHGMSRELELHRAYLEQVARILDLDPRDREARDILGLDAPAAPWEGVARTPAASAAELIEAARGAAEVRDRARALRGLGELRPDPEIRAVLEDCLAAEQPFRVREQALISWTRLWGEQRLRELLTGGGGENRRLAARVTGELGLGHLASELGSALLDGEREVRLQAFVALRLLGETVLNYDPEAPEPERRAAVERWLRDRDG